jgi:hypothetical protein
MWEANSQFKLSWCHHSTRVFNIKCDSWLMDITAGDDTVGVYDQESLYKYVSVFGRWN